ncbi:MAG: chemotaxis protein CheX [Deltaproteobacteria bacterium]|nr:chemotaxis protein CheX [Deltaproteobacteria bacterium]
MKYKNLPLDCLSEVLNVFCKIKIDEWSVTAAKFNEITDWLDCTAFIQLKGSNIDYFLSLSADLRFLSKIYANIFGEYINEVNSEVGDLLGEICNQTAGKVKTVLSPQNHSFDMATPVVVFGQNLKFRNLGDLEGELFATSSEFGKASFFVHSKELKNF